MADEQWKTVTADGKVKKAGKGGKKKKKNQSEFQVPGTSLSLYCILSLRLLLLRAGLTRCLTRCHAHRPPLALHYAEDKELTEDEKLEVMRKASLAVAVALIVGCRGRALYSQAAAPAPLFRAAALALWPAGGTRGGEEVKGEVKGKVKGEKSH